MLRKDPNYMMEWHKRNKEHDKQYRQVHKTQLSATAIRWQIENPERAREINKKSKLNRKKQINEYNKQYSQTHPEYERERKKKWCIKHPNYKREYRLEHSEQFKGYWRKQHSKRERNLGFNPLNDLFVGSEAHHIDFELVVYIPKELHRSIWHNIHTGQRMTEINDKAFEWLIEHGDFT
jgi:hypothetical protein